MCAKKWFATLLMLAIVGAFLGSGVIGCQSIDDSSGGSSSDGHTGHSH